MNYKLWAFTRPEWGYAFSRIQGAFEKFSPSNITWTKNPDEADINLIHVVGTGEKEVIERSLDSGKKTIIVQHVFFTGGECDWLSLWKRALLTISFHDLQSYFPNDSFPNLSINWGVDPSQFSRLAVRKTQKALTTGHVLDTELIDKEYEACKNIGQTLLHTGTNFHLGKGYQYVPFLKDKEFNLLLNSVEYVFGLRAIEGYELMCSEGLFCGCRPIVPNLPTYRWYREHGIFIDMNKDIVKQLEIILENTPKEPNLEEMKEIHNKFSWQNLIPRIFQEIK